MQQFTIIVLKTILLFLSQSQSKHYLLEVYDEKPKNGNWSGGVGLDGGFDYQDLDDLPCCPWMVCHLISKLLNPISHDVFDQHKAMRGGSRNPPLLIPVKQKIEISVSV